MKRFRFDRDVAWPISDHGSAFRLSRLLWARSGEVRVDVAFLGAGDTIGRHPAGLPQLFCVLRGSGWVQGADAIEHPIEAGEAVFWPSGEEHAAGTEHGFTAVIVQAAQLDPEATLPSA